MFQISHSLTSNLLPLTSYLYLLFPTFFKCSAISHFRQTCPDATALLVNLHCRFLDISSRFLHDAQHSLTTIPYWFLV